MTTHKEYILLAHSPKEGVELGEFLQSVEWSIYIESQLPMMLRKKEHLESVFHFVFVRECSEIINDGELARRSAGLTRA